MNHYDRAWALYQVDRFKEAESHFHRLVEDTPTNGYYWEALGHCLKMQGKHEEALEMYRMAMLMGSRDPNLYVYVAECLNKSGNRENCLKMLELAEKKLEDRKKPSLSLLKKMWS